MRDKILMGLVVIAILAIFGFGMADDMPSAKRDAQRTAEQGQQPGQTTAQAPGQAPGHAPAPQLPGQAPGQGPGQAPGPQAQPAAQTPAASAAGPEPAHATKFVQWWLNSAMDYNTTSAYKSHQDALAWMTPQGQHDFCTYLWTPSIAQNVCSGRVVAAFQPTAIQAQAVNPDGSVVVGVMGTVVIQGQAQPVVQQFLGNFLVKQDPEGLRVSGLYTRQAPLAIY